MGIIFGLLKRITDGSMEVNKYQIQYNYENFKGICGEKRERF